MIYNAPNTVYYKEAKKLLTKGDQIIDSYDLRIQDLTTPYSSSSSSITTTSATTSTSTSTGVNRRSSSKSKGLTSTSTRRVSSAVAPLSGVTKYSMYIPKNNITLSSQHNETIDNNISNLNIYNNYIDNYMYCKPSVPIYNHNFDNKKSLPISNYSTKYINDKSINKVEDYLSNLLEINVNNAKDTNTTITDDISNSSKEFQDIYEEYKEHFLNTSENILIDK